MIKNKTSLRGFTLLELIVVIAIIGVLSVIILPSFTTALARSRDGRKISELRGFQAGLIQFAQNNNGLYPANMTMPVQSAGCNTTTASSSLCAIVATGIDTRLPAGAYAGAGQIYNYVGQACYSATGLCQTYQLWTNLEAGNNALSSDADSSATSAATTTNVFGNSFFSAAGLVSNMITVGTANGQSELCGGVTNTCIFDLVP